MFVFDYVSFSYPLLSLKILKLRIKEKCLEIQDKSFREECGALYKQYTVVTATDQAEPVSCGRIAFDNPHLSIEDIFIGHNCRDDKENNGLAVEQSKKDDNSFVGKLRNKTNTHEVREISVDSK